MTLYNFELNCPISANHGQKQSRFWLGNGKVDFKLFKIVSNIGRRKKLMED